MKARVRRDLTEFVFTTSCGKPISNKAIYDARWVEHDKIQLRVDDGWCYVDSIDFEYGDFSEPEALFPNGFQSWMETHHEVVQLLSEYLIENNLSVANGQASAYAIGKRLTDKFENLNASTDWDEVSFLESIEEFMEAELVHLAEFEDAFLPNN